MKIALLTYSTKPRGGVIHTLEVAGALQALGHNVGVYALSKEGAGFDRPLPYDPVLVPAHPVSGGIDAVIRQRIQEYIDYFRGSESSYDIYHAQDCISANALSSLRQEGRIPHFVRTVHHIEAFSSSYLRECQDRSIREPNLCLCVSSLWQEELRRLYGIQAFRVINGVDRQRFRPTGEGSEAEVKAKWGLTGHPIYLTVGGIEPRKNSLVLLQAFRQVLREFPRAQLVIAGGDTLFDYQDYRDQFWALVQQSDIALNQSLVVTGSVPHNDLPQLFRLADAFVFPSLQEGWGLVVLEAIAARIPVLTSRCPPFTEFLNEDQALLVDPHSAEAIAGGMRALTDAVLSRSLVEHSQTILSSYTWELSAQLHRNAYQSLFL